jgi:tetratricopeptide (TPR) repeat protein
MMPIRNALVIALVGVVLGFASQRAVADDAATRAAKRHYQKGDRLFALGKFEAALVEFEAAYQAKPVPKLLFNIAQAHRNLDHYDQAIFSYRKYLREVPDADNREAVEKLIDDLEAKSQSAKDDDRQRLAALDLERQRDRDRGQPPTNPGDHKPIYTRWWFWGGIAAVAGASTGGYLLLRSDGVPSTDLGNVVFD